MMHWQQLDICISGAAQYDGKPGRDPPGDSQRWDRQNPHPPVSNDDIPISLAYLVSSPCTLQSYGFPAHTRRGQSRRFPCADRRPYRTRLRELSSNVLVKKHSCPECMMNASGVPSKIDYMYHLHNATDMQKFSENFDVVLSRENIKEQQTRAKAPRKLEYGRAG
eukprot:754034-Hanusia_phi.AAC.1